MRNNFRFNKPRYEQQFEDLCQKILESKCGYLNVHRYGRKGQKQHGIDILIKYGKSLIAVQCKHYASISKNNRIKIEEDIANFQREFSRQRRPFRVDHFVIVTSCSRDTKTIDHIQGLNERAGGAKSEIPVSIKFWEDIEDLLNTQDDVASWYGVSDIDYTPRRESHKVNYFSLQSMDEEKTTISGCYHCSSVTATKHDIHIRFKDAERHIRVDPKSHSQSKKIILDLRSVLETLDLLTFRAIKRFSVRANDGAIVIRRPEGRGETTVKLVGPNVFVDGHKELNESREELYRILANKMAEIRMHITISSFGLVCAPKKPPVDPGNDSG